MTRRILLLDVGNTRVHAAIAEGGSILLRRSLDLSGLDSFAPDPEGGARPDLALAASVNPANAARLGKRLADLGIRLRWVPGDVAHPIPVATASPEATGADRVLAAAAALALAGGPVVVVDAGTAVTVDRADPNAGFLGGAILPGLRAMARALHRETGLLPEIDPHETLEEGVPRTTAQSILLGVRSAWWGGIREAARRLGAGEAGVEVVATGGDADLLLPWPDGDVRRVPDLALRGLLIAAARAGIV